MFREHAIINTICSTTPRNFSNIKENVQVFLQMQSLRNTMNLPRTAPKLRATESPQHENYGSVKKLQSPGGDGENVYETSIIHAS